MHFYFLSVNFFSTLCTLLCILIDTIIEFLCSTDKMSEAAILDIVRKNFRNHLILGEEGGLIGESSSDYLWCIDPLGLAHKSMNLLRWEITTKPFFKFLLALAGFLKTVFNWLAIMLTVIFYHIESSICVCDMISCDSLVAFL